MKNKLFIIILIFFTLNLSSCYIQEGKTELRENQTVYDLDKSDNLYHIYLEVGDYIDDNNKKWNFDSLNSYCEEEKLDISLPTILKDGTENSNSVFGAYGYKANTYNSTLKIRGNTTEKNKSYKITINDGEGLYHMQKTFNLMKYSDDISRVRTKYYYDLLSDIYDTPGLRSRLVELHVKSSSDSSYKNLGLYTMVEQPNRQYLRSHSLGEGSLVYKANNFDFTYNENIIKNAKDKDYNEAEFEEVIELSEGNTNHKEIIKMLKDINDYSIDIDETVDKYFSRDNILSFTALNILTENRDVVDHNYLMIYRNDDKKWFLTAWNCEDILQSVYDPKKKQIPNSLFSYNIFNENILYKRFYSKEENIKQLEKRIEYVYEKVMSKSDDLIKGYVDIINYERNNKAESILNTSTGYPITDFIKDFKTIINNNYEKYIDTKKLPYIFHVVDTEVNENNIYVKWNKGLNKKELKYKVILCRDANGNNIVEVQEKIDSFEATFNVEENGEYYIKVVAINDEGEQISSSIYTNPFGKKFYGVDRVIVK